MSHTPFPAVLGVVLAGCGPTFDTVQDACPDSVAGAARLPDALADAVFEMACVRRFLSLPPVRVDARLTGTAADHLAWLAANPPPVPSPLTVWLEETPPADGSSDTSFVGETPFERIVATGLGLGVDPPSSVFSMVIDDDGTGGASLASRWLSDAAWRDLWLQPGPLAVGVAGTDVGDVTTVLVDAVSVLPPNRTFGRPVVWPRDVAEDVAPAWTPSRLLTSPPWGATPGAAVSVTVGDGLAGARFGLPGNPYAMTVGDVLWTTEDGEPIPFAVVAPSGAVPFGWTRTTLLLVPRAPLPADTRFRVEATMTVRAGTVRAAVAFTTAEAGSAEDAP